MNTETITFIHSSPKGVAVIATNGPITVRFDVIQGGKGLQYTTTGSNVTLAWCGMAKVALAAARWLRANPVREA